ncbi:MAG TPA: hypothetical protein DCS93_38450 [Microscillaceae bacterium]|nr:hypothetical protein [Microscillaceae bacterium]
MKVLSKPLAIGCIILVNLLLNIHLAFAQPVVEKVRFYVSQTDFPTITKGFRLPRQNSGSDSARHVPLNYFIVEINFNENILPTPFPAGSGRTSDNLFNSRYDLSRTIDILDGSSTSLITGVASLGNSDNRADLDVQQNSQSILFLLRLTADLSPNTTYTLRLRGGALRNGAGDVVPAQDFSFRTSNALSVTGGTASGDLCQTEVATVSPILISEVSAYGFVRNKTGELDIHFDDSDFKFDNNQSVAGKELDIRFLGPKNSSNPIINSIDVNADRIRINYTIEDAGLSNTLMISGVRVIYNADRTQTAHIRVDPADLQRYDFVGLAGQNLVTIEGRATIPDLDLNPSAITGVANHCLSSGSRVYSVDPVTGANAYLWTVSSTFFDVTGATATSVADQWRTTTNSITLTPKAVTGGTTTLTVKAVNNCRESQNPRVKNDLRVTANLNDPSLNLSPGDITGPSGSPSICSNAGTSFRYTVPRVAGATQYEWTIPPQFGGGTTTTTDNYIDLTPSGAGTGISISVRAINGCLRGVTEGTITGITINSPTLAGDLSFESIDLGSFPSGGTPSIAVNANTQTLTVNVSGGTGTVTFSGDGVGGAGNNEFYASVVGIGNSSTVTYRFVRDGTGCVTTGTFTINVFDPNATISGVTNYCDNVTSDQEFRVKTSANGFPIPSGNVVLQRLTAPGGIITQSPTSGFRLDRTESGDYVFFLVPSTLMQGTYRITATNVPSPLPPPLVTPPPQSFTKTFVVNTAPNPSISRRSGIAPGTGTAIDPFVVCAASTSSFQVPAISGRTYSWVLSGGGTISGSSNGSIVTIDWTSSTTGGNFDLSVTETNTTTNCSETVTSRFTVNPQPSPTITPDGTNNNCVGLDQTYTASGGTSYIWNVDPAEGRITSPTSTGNQVTIQWNNVGSGTVNLIARNAAGCQNNTDVTVMINTPPIPGFAPTTPTVNLKNACINSTGYTYTINAVPSGHSVIWEVTGGTIQSPSGNVTTFSGTELNSVVIDWGNAPGDATIRVTQRDGSGCEGTVTETVTLNRLPSVVVSGITTNQQFCLGSPMVNLVANANGAEVNNLNNGLTTDVGVYTITDASDALITTLANGVKSFDPTTLTPAGIGNYKLVFNFVDARGCSANTITIPFSVLSRPPVAINSTTSTIVNTPTDTTGSTCARGTQVYTVDGGIIPTNSYSWSVSGGIVLSQASDNSQITVNWGTLAMGTITLTVRSSSSCEASTTANITINPLPAPTFATAATSACVNSTNEMYTINTTNTAHTFRWVVENGAIQGGTIRPDGKSEIMGAGVTNVAIDWTDSTQGVITVTETDLNNCVGSVARIIALTPLPALTFTGLNAAYCEGDGAITLAPSVNGGAPTNPGSGKFLVRDAADVQVLDLGAGVNTFNPSTVVGLRGTGDYKVVYQYTDDKSCFAESQPIVFRINPSPKGLRVQVERRFDSRNVIFRASANNVTPAWKWNWTFTGVTKSRQVDTLTLTTNTAQSISYSLLVENAEGCQLDSTKVFNIDFNFQGKCFGTATQFNDLTTLGADPIEGRLWEFGDGSTSTAQNPTHTYAAAGTYFVKLTVTQSIFSYSMVKRIDIFPVFNVTPADTYNEDFTSGAAGWVSHGIVDSNGVALDRTSWRLKVPNGFGNIPADKGNSWVTDNTGSSVAVADAKYNGNEQSFVESPCFNINALNRPMVSFSYFSDLDRGSDGVVLLYTIDDGTNWFRVGVENQGLQWYDTKPILGKPGDSFSSDNGDSQGWSGNTQVRTTPKVWKVARFGLDEVLNRMNAAGVTNRIVRFRVAFGSNSDNTPNVQFDGFAFDDFQVNNRNRLVLSEFFINQTADPDGAIDLAGHTFAETKAEAMNIHYHTDFPGVDEINTTSEQDVSARSFHYGIRDVPRIVVDGVTRDEVPVLTNGAANNWADSVFSTRTLINAPFLISIANPTATSGVLTINATVNAIEAVNKQTVMHVVVIDSTVTLGGVTYYNAVRKMLPDAAGEFRAQNWTAGDSQTLSYTWDYGSLGLDPARFRVVVFVADYENKEVYQAEVSNIQVVRVGGGSGNNPDQVTSIADDLKGDNVKLFPNPTNRYLNVSLQNKGISSDAKWEIISMTGQVMKRGIWTRGYQQIQLDIADLAEGVYIISVSDGKTVFRRKFEKH